MESSQDATRYATNIRPVAQCLSESVLTIASGGNVDSGRGPRVQEGFYCLDLKADILPTSNSKNVTVQTAFLFINHRLCYIKSGGGIREEGVTSLLGDLNSMAKQE